MTRHFANPGLVHKSPFTRLAVLSADKATPRRKRHERSFVLTFLAWALVCVLVYGLLVVVP